MALGPVSILAIQFSENNFRGEILAALYDLVKNGTVRIIDAVVVAKDQIGEITVQEVNQLAPTVVAIFDPLDAEVTGLLSYDDIHNLGALLDPNSSAGLLALEHVWAERLAQAIIGANGKVVTNQLIMPDVLEEQSRSYRDRTVTGSVQFSGGTDYDHAQKNDEAPATVGGRGRHHSRSRRYRRCSSPSSTEQVCQPGGPTTSRCPSPASTV